MQSVLAPKGATYTVLSRGALCGPGGGR